MTYRLTTSEALDIEQLLRAGHSVVEACVRTGRSRTTIKAVRDARGIRVHAAGRRAAPPSDPPMEHPEGGWDPSGNSCPLLYAERPHQQRWLELIRAAGPSQLCAMRRAVRRVLGVSADANEDTLATAAITDRRTADELARLYLAAM